MVLCSHNKKSKKRTGVKKYIISEILSNQTFTKCWHILKSFSPQLWGNLLEIATQIICHSELPRFDQHVKVFSDHSLNQVIFPLFWSLCLPPKNIITSVLLTCRLNSVHKYFLRTDFAQIQQIYLPHKVISVNNSLLVAYFKDLNQIIHPTLPDWH